jgi:hypothetical protein
VEFNQFQTVQSLWAVFFVPKMDFFASEVPARRECSHKSQKGIDCSEIFVYNFIIKRLFFLRNRVIILFE